MDSDDSDARGDLFYCGCLTCQRKSTLWRPRSTWYRHTKMREAQIASGQIPRPTGAQAVVPSKKRRAHINSSSSGAAKRVRQEPNISVHEGADAVSEGGLGQTSGTTLDIHTRPSSPLSPRVGPSHLRGHTPPIDDPQDEIRPPSAGPSRLRGHPPPVDNPRNEIRPPIVPPSPRMQEEPANDRVQNNAAPLRLPTSSCIPTIDHALKYIDMLRNNPILADDNLDADVLYRLQHPPTTRVDLTPDERESIDFFLATTDGSRRAYEKTREGALLRHPEDEILSYHLVKKKVAELSGVTPITHDMCPNSCMAYTGPFADLDKCIVEGCGEPRYDQADLARGIQRPRLQWCTFPVGPQIQARFRSPDGAHDMRHREREMPILFQELLGEEHLKVIRDIFYGSVFWDAYRSGKIAPDDVVLIYSMDGAQLYEHKASNCWIYIWILVDLAPDKRYKKCYLLPGAIVPGPNKPRLPDSFNYPGLHHVAALENEGFKIYDGLHGQIFESRPYIFLAEADAVGAPEVHGYVGHHGAFGCRERCGRKGRRKPGGSHYYAVSLKPDGYNEAGCNHPDDEPSKYIAPQSEEEYTQDIIYLSQAPNQTAYEERRLETGLSKPSIFLGLSKNHRTEIPGLFCGDIMHAAGLNITDHMQKLLRGLVPCDTKNGDNKDSWRRWMCLTGDAWERHGALVVAARSYLPSSIERPPRNPCRKSSSGYKCLEFLVWIYVLAPALLFGVLEFSLWQHFCKLVMGIRIVFQRQATQVELERAHQLLADFKYDLEVKYAECKISRMHFMPQCTHAITHFPFSYTRIGPCICSSQFPIERTIGDLGAEIKQHSNPFANLAQRALRRAQVNCLKALYPEFSDASDIAPSQAPSCILEGGYVLLHPRDNRPREVRDAEALAIRAYLRSTIGPDAGEASWHDKQEAVRKWSRCRLPNREVGRSRMRETGGRRITRISRNVKFHTPNGFGYAEVLYYFQWKIASAVRALALVSKYGDPDPFLLANSFGAVWAAPALGDLGLAVIEVSSIVAVVGMVPHKFRTEHTNGIEVELYFVAEKLGAEIEFLDSRDDDEDREDEEDTDEDDDDDEE